MTTLTNGSTLFQPRSASVAGEAMIFDITSEPCPEGSHASCWGHFAAGDVLEVPEGRAELLNEAFSPLGARLGERAFTIRRTGVHYLCLEGGGASTVHVSRPRRESTLSQDAGARWFPKAATLRCLLFSLAMLALSLATWGQDLTELPEHTETSVVTLSDDGLDQVPALSSLVAVHGDRAILALDGQFPSLGVSLHFVNGAWRRTGQLDSIDHDEFNPSGGANVALSEGHVLLGFPDEAKREGVVLHYVPRDAGGAKGYELYQSLVPPESSKRDRFGAAVAVDAHRALIGAPGNSGVKRYGGVVFVFEQTYKKTLQPVGEIRPKNARLGMRFGSQVALAGDRAAVIAEKNEDGQPAVFVFEKEGDAWVQKKQFALQGKAGLEREFGASLTMNENRIAVGASGSEGGVYLFERDKSGAWAFADKVEPRSPVESFGSSVALYADQLLVGAPKSLGDEGQAVLFHQLADGEWTSGVRLTSTLPEEGGGYLGRSVALGAHGILVGRRQRFKKDEPWRRTSSGLFSDPFSDDPNKGLNDWREHKAVAVHYAPISVGDIAENDRGAGPAYLLQAQVEGEFFELPHGGWTQSSMGKFVATGEGLAILGDPWPGHKVPGRAEVYEPSTDGTWKRTYMLDDSSTRVMSSALATDGRRVAAAGYVKDGPNVVTIFERNGSEWIQTATLEAPAGAETEYFGEALDIDGDVVAIGYGDHTFVERKVFVYERSRTGDWTMVAELQEADTDPYERGRQPPYTEEQYEDEFSNEFGASVSVSGHRLLVGCPTNGSSRYWGDYGAVYLYERTSNGSWEYVTRVSGPRGFGRAVDLEGERFIVGRWWGRLGDEPETGPEVRMFELTSSGAWPLVARLIPAKPLQREGTADSFGLEVELDGDFAFVARYEESPNSSVEDVGAVYVFQRRGAGTWGEHSKLVPPGDRNGGLEFGRSLDADDGVLVIGSDDGQAFVLKRVP